jgi:hypothetical protein
MKKHLIADQTDIKAGDKVVCIDDAYQRRDLADAPDGLLVRGQVYCVSGVSECGGVLLAGFRVVSLSTGKEVGFDPDRFLPLEQFRLKFPEGTSAIPDGDDGSGYLAEEESKLKKQFEFPEIEGLEEPKPLVLRVIEVLEGFYENFHEPESTPPWMESGYVQDQSPEQVQLELRRLLRSPQLSAYMNQSVEFWLRLIRYQKPTVLFCRNYSPVAMTLFQMCMSGNIITESFLDGDFKERDFPILTSAAGRLVSSPIRICDARAPDTFLRVLSDARKVFEYAMCDWTLEGDELVAARRVTQDSPITFLCPFGEEMGTEGSNPEQEF